MIRQMILLAALCGVVGCSQPRARVYGTVAYRGKALSEGTVFFLASPDADFISGQTIAVDGGKHML